MTATILLNMKKLYRSKFNSMDKLAIIGGVAAALIVCGVGGTSLLGDICVTNGRVSQKILRTIPPQQSVAPEKLSPGVYQTFPYSMRVMVPGPISPNMELKTSPNSLKGQILVAKPNPPLEFRRMGDQFPAQTNQNHTGLP
jgi:hypothetical protein